MWKGGRLKSRDPHPTLFSAEVVFRINAPFWSGNHWSNWVMLSLILGISHSHFSFLTITLCLFLAFCDRLCNIVIYLVLHFPGYYWHQSSYFSNDSMKLNVWDDVSLFKCVSTIHYLSWDAFMDWVIFLSQAPRVVLRLFRFFSPRRQWFCHLLCFSLESRNLSC